MLARKDQRLADFVEDRAEGSPGWDSPDVLGEQGERRDNIRKVWREVVLALNPSLARGPAREGDRVQLPNYTESLEIDRRLTHLLSDPGLVPPPAPGSPATQADVDWRRSTLMPNLARKIARFDERIDSPDETVRRKLIAEALDIVTPGDKEHLYLIRVMLRDTSAFIRGQAATEIDARLPAGVALPLLPDDDWQLRAEEFWLDIHYTAIDGNDGPTLRLAGPKAPRDRLGSAITADQAKAIIRLFRTFEWPGLLRGLVPVGVLPCHLRAWGRSRITVSTTYAATLCILIASTRCSAGWSRRSVTKARPPRTWPRFRAAAEKACPELVLAESFRKAADGAVLVKYHGQRDAKGEPIDLLLYWGKQPRLAMPKNAAKLEPGQVSRLIERLVVSGVFTNAADVTGKQVDEPAGPCYTLTLIGPRELHQNMGWRIDLINHAGWLAGCVRGGEAEAAVNRLVASLAPLEREWLDANVKAARAAMAAEPPIAVQVPAATQRGVAVPIRIVVTPPTGSPPPIAINLWPELAEQDSPGATYLWDFGKLGGVSRFKSPNVLIRQPGQFHILLTVTTKDGRKGRAGVTITIPAAKAGPAPASAG